MLCVQVSHAVWKNICRRRKKNKDTRVSIPPLSAFISCVAWNCSGKRVCTSKNGSGLSGYGAGRDVYFPFHQLCKDVCPESEYRYYESSLADLRLLNDAAAKEAGCKAL